jgi:hypothetical protein
MTTALYAVTKCDMWGKITPVAICKSLTDADAMVDSLSDSLPNGVLEFYSRQEVSAHAEGFRLVKSAATALAFAE